MSSTDEGRVQARSAGPQHRVGVPPRVTLTVNGAEHSLTPGMSLLSALRGELGLTGAKPGCGEGACGSCTVLVNDRPVRSCQQPVEEIAGASVTTIEGLATGGRLHPVQQAFVEVGAAQCGYCTPGMVLSVVALLAHDPDPDDAAVSEALSGNLCRCGVYTRVRKAVHRAAELIARPDAADETLVTAIIEDWKVPDPCRARLQAGAAVGHDRSRRPRLVRRTRRRAGRWFSHLQRRHRVPGRPAAAPGCMSRSDGTVTAFTGKVDVGQDNRTALRLLVAEELRRAPRERPSGDGGHRSVSLRHGHLRQPIHARRRQRPQPGRRVRPPAVAGAGRDTKSRDRHGRARGHPSVKVADRRVCARTRRHGRRWSRAPCSSALTWTCPGLWHGCMLRPPVFKSVLGHLDATALDGRSDVMVVETPVGVGVVARDRAEARAALAGLKATWEIPDAPSDDDSRGVPPCRIPRRATKAGVVRSTRNKAIPTARSEPRPCASTPPTPLRSSPPLPLRPG